MIPGIYNNIQINAAGQVIGGGTLDYPDEVATGAEVNTGTDNEKYVTALAIEDSLYIKAAYADAKVADAINNGTTTIAPSQNAVFDALALKLDSNTAITGATKTKITYDADGLVTAGSDATTADITDSSNKRYATDAEIASIDSHGQLYFFDLLGTDITISGTSDGSTNMVKINVATALSQEVNFNNGGSDNGRIKYTGVPTIKCTIAATIGFTTFINADAYVFCIAKTGTTDNSTRNIYTSRTTTDLDSVAITGMVELATNDYVELYVGNMTEISNIKIKSLNLWIT